LGRAIGAAPGAVRVGLTAVVFSLAAAFSAPATAQSDPAFEKDWAELVASAKKEGKLVLSIGAMPEYLTVLSVFTEKYGIPVQTDGGSGSSRATRILAERRAGRSEVDVGLLSVAATTRRLEPAGALGPISEMLIHPEVTDTSKWYGNRHWYVDHKGTKTIFVYSSRANNNWLFWYNTDKLTAADVASLKTPGDFLDPKWKGKMSDQSWGDPGRLGGMLEMYFAPDAGPEWIKKYLTEMDVAFTSDTRLEETWLVRGRNPLKWDEGNVGDALLKYQKQFPIKVVELPRKQGKLEARGSECCLVVFKDAPHPNAAKLFVNWFLSKEGQTLVHAVKPPRRYTSLREDIPPLNTAEINRRVPGKDYTFRDFDEKYLKEEKAARDFIIAHYQGPKVVTLTHSGKVLESNRQGREIVIDHNGEKVSAKVSSSKTAVTIGGKKSKRSAVKVGMTCTFVYPGPGTQAKKVDCK